MSIRLPERPGDPPAELEPRPTEAEPAADAELHVSISDLLDAPPQPAPATALDPTKTVGFIEEVPAPRPVWSGRRVARLKERRKRRWLWIALAVTLAVVAATVVVFTRGEDVVPTAPAGGPAPSSMVWVVRSGKAVMVAVIGVPGDRSPAAVVIPGETRVDLPGGEPPVVGSASSSGAGAMQAVQATLNQRVGHYLVSTDGDLGALADRLGGIDVVMGSALPLGDGTTLGPGPAKLTGAQVTAYLQGARGGDRTGRWEDVLAGLLGGPKDSTAWGRVGDLGLADDPSAVARVLREANGAAVLELPTQPAVGGGIKPDRKAMDALLASRFVSSLGTLVRITVLNGNGRPSQGAVVGELLAPAGYRVVASQNASTFDIPLTKVIAANQGFVEAANEAQRLLGAGKVYLGSQPTGISDLTIVVGKDFRPD